MVTYKDLEAVFAPNLIITICGTLQAQAVFKNCNGSFLLVKTSNETLMEKLLKIKIHELCDVKGDLIEELFREVNNHEEYEKYDQPLLLLLYKHAINNYYNKDLVIVNAPLELVKKKFEKLWDLVSPLSTFKNIVPKVPADMREECEEYSMKALELVDKFATLRLSSNQAKNLKLRKDVVVRLIYLFMKV
ncbi:hypothetical protein BD770DRAFT_405839 [Pilaira anomala]|nr:hypothetical protein BD770DRAFT_405839 [Pilaira anomala]